MDRICIKQAQTILEISYGEGMQGINKQYH
jgi:hypothetical protein